MDYNEIIDAYKNHKLDISDIKSNLKKAKTLCGRDKHKTVYLSGKNTDFKTMSVNLLSISENTEKVEEFYNELEKNLAEYYNTLVTLIQANDSWKFMGLNSQNYSLQKYNKLDFIQKFNILEELNKKYIDYLKYQKLADIRDYIKFGNELKDEDINKILFIQLMFNNIENFEIKRELFCFDKKFITVLIEYKKSKVKRMEDFIKTKRKEIIEEFERFSLFFNKEDFRDISECIVLTSKAIKTTNSFIIGAFYKLSENDLEEYYIKEEYNYLTLLKNKYLIMSELGKKLKSKRKLQQIEKEKIEENQKKILQLKVKQKALKKKKAKQDEKLEEQKKEIIDSKSDESNDEQNNNESKNKKEQVNPLIFSWFEKDDVSLTKRIGAQNLSRFFDKIKQIEEQTGIRVSLFLVTNANQEITLKRIQELQKNAKANGLDNLVEGAFGGYSSFRIDNNGEIAEISIMSKENRNRIIKLLEKPVKFYLPKDIIDETEQNYLRYQFATKKDNIVTHDFLSNCISRILLDDTIKKQPLQFLPYIENDLAGIDVLLSSQLEGIKQLPEYYKYKYEFAPGKTIRINIDTLIEFLY